MFARWSLRKRVTTLFLATSIAILALGAIALSWNILIEWDRARQEAKDLATLIGEEVGRRVTAVHGLGGTLAHLPAVADMRPAATEPLFRMLLVQFPQVENICLVATSGTVVASAVPLPRIEPLDMARRPWFHQVLAAGRPVVGGYQISLVTRKAVAVIAHPVRDPAGQIVGVLKTALRLDRPPGTLAASPRRGATRWAVVDQDGIVLFQNATFGSAGGPLGELAGSIRSEVAVPDTPWRAVVAIPEATVWEQIWLLLRFRLMMGLLLVMALGVTYAIARSTWRPAQALAEAVRRIGTGEEGVKLPTDSPPEIAEVATALGDTLGALHQRQRELTALLQASQALTSSLDLDEILRAVIEQAARISGAPAVRLLVLDGATATLRYRIGIGIPPEEERQIVIPVGASFSGHVAATGQPLAVPDCRQDRRLHYPAHVQKHHLISYLGLPVTARERLIGVLVVNTTAPRGYSAAEIALFSTFAGQAATALENARLVEELRRATKDLEARIEERTRALSEANAELARTSRHKSEFLANMSHELRTPLNSVIGFSEVLLTQRAGPLTEKQTRYLGHIQRSGKHLLQLISDILDLSKVEAGKLSLQLQAVSIQTVIEEVLVITRGFAHQKAQSLQAELAPELPPLWADPVRVKQILFNLLSNAVKFTPEHGSITIRAGRARAAGPDPPEGPIEEGLEIAVQDTGIGIAAEDLPRLFKEFVQLELAATKQHEGTGLGLALTKRLVELHRGRIWAESAGPGCGACFTVRLPFLEPPPPKRVLVVEDQPLVQEALALALQTAGLAVERAMSGAEALQQLSGTPPDLLILDVGLPDVDGWDVLARVRGEARTASLPVLVITGQDQVRAERALALGANEFLAKPVSPRVLLETVTRLLGAERGGSGG